MREERSFHVLFYEDLLLNPPREIEKLNEFLELPSRLSEGQLDYIVKETRFESQQMKEKLRLKPKDIGKPLFHRQGGV